MENTQKSPMLSNRTYDGVKWVAQYLLPALATAYSALGILWGFPNTEQIVGTLVILDTFLGALLGISKKSYKNSGAAFDGEMVVDTSNPGKDLFSLEANTSIDELAEKDQITFKVRKDNSQ